MSSTVNNFFESLTNSTNSRFMGTPSIVHTPTGYSETFHMSQTAPPIMQNGVPYYKT